MRIDLINKFEGVYPNFNDDWHFRGLQRFSDLTSLYSTADAKQRDMGPIGAVNGTARNNPNDICSSPAEVRKRAVITAETAAEIYSLRTLRPDSTGPLDAAPSAQVHSGRSVLISRMFGISPKAVRDIWNLRTWRHVTRGNSIAAAAATGTDAAAHAPLMPHRSAAMFAGPRPIGRPRGSKDSRPRRRRAVVTTASLATATTTTACESCIVPSGWPMAPPSGPPLPLPPPPPFWWAEGCRPVVGKSLPPPPAAVEEQEELELRRFFPFFLQDPLTWAPDSAPASRLPVLP
jgi:hypothetical protein